MSRSTAQRLGDITVVLVAVAALSLISNVWTAADRADGHASTFWSYVGLTLTPALLPTFAGACLFTWMDDARRRSVKWLLLSMFALAAVAAVGEAIFGGNFTMGTGDRGASYLSDATSLLLVAGGFTLMMGLLPDPADSAADQ